MSRKEGAAMVGHDSEAIVRNIWAEFLAQILVMGTSYIKTV